MALFLLAVVDSGELAQLIIIAWSTMRSSGRNVLRLLSTLLFGRPLLAVFDQARGGRLSKKEGGGAGGRGVAPSLPGAYDN